MQNIVRRHPVTLGCDPELFFVNKQNNVVASEKVIPKNTEVQGGSFIQDGVQAEINPLYNTCRQTLSNNIARLIVELNRKAKKKETTLSLDVSKTVTKKHFSEISDDCKRFGCASSFNVYKKGVDKTSEIKADPMIDRERSTGGHIHLGTSSGSFALCDSFSEDERRVLKALKNHKRLIPLLDILVGNTSVLLDRRSGNKERRVNYGKAGEFRPTDYGIEYRTPSNFWLQSYPLFSLIFALARTAVEILADSNPESSKSAGMEKRLREAVRITDIKKAINNDDYDLALDNYKKIEKILIEICNNQFPINKKNHKTFHYFLNKGVDYWFEKDFVGNWSKRLSSSSEDQPYREGWEAFLNRKVTKELDEEVEKIFGNIVDSIVEW